MNSDQWWQLLKSLGPCGLRPLTVTNARNSVSKSWSANEAEGIRRNPGLLVGLDKMSNALLTG